MTDRKIPINNYIDVTSVQRKGKSIKLGVPVSNGYQMTVPLIAQNEAIAKIHEDGDTFKQRIETALATWMRTHHREVEDTPLVDYEAKNLERNHEGIALPNIEITLTFFDRHLPENNSGGSAMEVLEPKKYEIAETIAKALKSQYHGLTAPDARGGTSEQISKHFPKPGPSRDR